MKNKKTQNNNNKTTNLPTVNLLEKSNNDDVKLEIHDYNGLEPYLNRKDDKIYVVNFWATWCAPCVKEMPHFEELNKNYQNKIILCKVSLKNLANIYGSMCFKATWNWKQFKKQFKLKIIKIIIQHFFILINLRLSFFTIISNFTLIIINTIIFYCIR